MAAGDNKKPTPSYFGSSLDDAVSVATSVNPTADAAYDLVKEHLNKDTMSKVDGVWGQISDMINGLIHWLLNCAFPNNTAAEDGLDAKIDQTTAFDKAEQITGIDGLANFIRTTCKQEVREFNGWGMMPKGDGVSTKAIDDANKVHDAIVKKVTQGLIDEHKNYSDPQIKVIAEHIASLASGLSVDDETSENATDRIHASTPTHGLAAALIATANSVGADGMPRGGFKVDDVADIDIDNKLLQTIASIQPAASAPPAKTDKNR